MSSYERVRAFIAIDIEEPLLVSRLVAVRDAFVATGAPMKPVEDQNLHITIRFLGNIPLAVADQIEEVLRQVKLQPFKIKLVGVGAFPSVQRPRVIWVGVGEGAEQLKAIFETVERGLRRLGFRPEREEFVPHITLARMKGSRNIERVVRLLEQYRDYEFGEMIVRRIRLKQSILTPRGPIYKTLREVELGSS